MSNRLQTELYLCAPLCADSYRKGTRVRVLRGEYRGEVATVTETFADGGDMCHVCRHDDGTTQTYELNEITALMGNL